jgi:hypothetical protein
MGREDKERHSRSPLSPVRSQCHCESDFYLWALFRTRKKQCLFHCPIVRIGIDDICSLRCGSMLIFQEQSIKIMTKRLNPQIAMAIGAPSRCPCKRSFEEFATPLEEKYLPEVDTPRGPTMKDLIAAGGDLSTILPSLCQLTNDIHPMFRAENICVCPYEGKYCMVPHFADYPEELIGKAKAPQTNSPCIKDFTDGVLVRTIFQLATRMLLHDDALPFWAGLMDAFDHDADGPYISFHVNPRRRLSKEDKERTLEHLEDFAAEHIRLHFQARQSDDGSMWDCEAETTAEPVLKDDPLYPACIEAREWKFYGWRDGKPIIVDRQQDFAHITINLTRFMPTRPLEDLLTMTISEMKIRMFCSASTLCHELAHTLEQQNCDHDYFNAPAMNLECVVETGFSFTNFLHGGLLECYEKSHEFAFLPWPCQDTVDLYIEDGTPMQWVRLCDAGPERLFPIKARQIEVFLEQSFWDDPTPPAGCWKKMWLKPHVELALDEDDFEYFTTGDTLPYQPQLKRRRFSDATKERRRVRRANAAWKKRNAVRFRWHRSKDVSEERKEEFHEREKERLNQLWVECTEGVDAMVLSK